MSPLRVWLAGVLITLGALWLLDAANVLDAGSTIDHWWPVAVMALAVCAAAAERRISLGPTVLFVIGALLLVDQLDVAKIDAVVWPIIAILAGLWLLVNRSGGAARAT